LDEEVESSSDEEVESSSDEECTNLSLLLST
jgi:hypothetical protein